MKSIDKKKICLVVSSLGHGGAEKSAALLSIILDKQGYEVHIVSVLNIIDYEFKGTLFNLGILKDEKDTFLGRIQRLLKFRSYLKKHDFHCIIDHRARVLPFREFIVTKFIYKSPVIYVIHNFSSDYVFTPYKWFNKYLYRNEIMVAVSVEAAEKFKSKYKLNNISTIYNTFNAKEINFDVKKELIDDELRLKKYIMFYGRMVNIPKNIKFLIKAFKESVLIEEGYFLLMLGDGEDLVSIKKYAKELNVYDKIIFKPYVVNPFIYVKNAKFVCLTSSYEGFPMVLVESLSLGVPVVSVNCKSGPKEIIIHKKNGLLVPERNIKAYVEAMNSMVENSDLYNICKQNTAASVDKFSEDRIGTQWVALIESIK